jgi:hypothetical protein
MMATSPKIYTATKYFSCAGAEFNEGDAVTGVALSAVLALSGHDYVTTERKTKADKAAQITPTPATPATTEGA